MNKGGDRQEDKQEGTPTSPTMLQLTQRRDHKRQPADLEAGVDMQQDGGRDTNGERGEKSVAPDWKPEQNETYPLRTNITIQTTLSKKKPVLEWHCSPLRPLQLRLLGTERTRSCVQIPIARPALRICEAILEKHAEEGHSDQDEAVYRLQSPKGDLSPNVTFTLSHPGRTCS